MLALNTYVNGLQLDYDQFRSEVKQACNHVRASQRAAGEKAGAETRTRVH